MLAPDLVDCNATISFLQYPNNLAFRKSRFLHLNLQLKSCQKVLLIACLLNGEAYDFTKESVDLVAEHGSSGQYVVRVLERAAQFRGLPVAIRTDQGPEFTSKALDQWAYQNGVQLKLIEAGKPTQNAYIESFNGRFRDECLNDHWFTSLAEARIRISAWRRDYNEHRPHSALNYRTPAEFAAMHRRQKEINGCQRERS